MPHWERESAPLMTNVIIHAANVLMPLRLHKSLLCAVITVPETRQCTLSNDRHQANWIRYVCLLCLVISHLIGHESMIYIYDCTILSAALKIQREQYFKMDPIQPDGQL